MTDLTLGVAFVLVPLVVAALVMAPIVAVAILADHVANRHARKGDAQPAPQVPTAPRRPVHTTYAMDGYDAPDIYTLDWYDRIHQRP